LTVLGRKWIGVVAIFAGLLGSVAVAVSAAAVGPPSGDGSHEWWFKVPNSWLHTSAGMHAMSWTFYSSLGLVGAAWLLLGLGVRAGNWRIRELWAVAAAWALPWLVGPMALSTDVYTYLGQGLVAGRGINPYIHGPETGGLPGGLIKHIPGIWMSKPSPYGPGFMGIDQIIAPLARYNVMLAVIVVRLVSLVGLVLAAVCLPRVARTAGGDPVVATWLGVCSPLALGAVVLSGHNDALMVGLLVAALALATQRLRWAAPAAIALATCAAMIKAPAAVGIAVLTVAWMLKADTGKEKAKRFGISVAVAGVVTVLVSVVTGLGSSWANLEAIQSPEAGAPQFTPAEAITWTLTQVFGVRGAYGDVLGVVQLAGMAIVGLLALVLLLRQSKVGTVRAAGMILAAVVLASPVTWPWYMMWPVMLLGAVVRGKIRYALLVVALGALFLTKADANPHALEKWGNIGVSAGALALAVLTAIWVYRTLLRRVDAPVARTTELVARG
jgi:hypothetical protein